MRVPFPLSAAQVIRLLATCFVIFVVLSWWLLFRDERALTSYEMLYPGLSLYPIRELMLHWGLNVIPTIIFAAVSVGAFALYWYSLQLTIPLKITITYAVIFQLIVLCSYPILSTDIFSYMFSDRVLTEYGQNVWKVTPNSFHHDPFEQLADWKDQTKVYGLVNQLAYIPAATMGNDDVLSTLVGYKVTALIFSIATIWILTKATADFDVTKQSQLLRTIAWNPLFVLEIAGSGHNDIIMIFFLVVALLFWKRQRWLLFGLFSALSVQVKIISIIFFIVFMLHLLYKKKIGAFLGACAAFGVLNIVCFLIMNVSPFSFLSRVLYNTSVYWQSLSSVIHPYYENEKIFFSVGLMILLATVLYGQFKYSWQPIYTSTLLLMGYLLIFTAAYWNWYSLWVLVIVPFVEKKWITATIILFTATSLLAYPLLWISLRYGFGNPLWSFIYYGWISVIPIVYMMRNLSRNKEDAK